MSVTLLILGLLLFVGLVIVHELGHFLVARRNGVEVEEFGIGFPPRAWGKKTKGGFIFSLNWLPIGGFVKLKGESDAATAKGTLGAASTWVKTKIMLAGVGMNVIVAFGLLTVLAWVGMPQLLDKQFTIKSDTQVIRSEVIVRYVEPKSPASKAGLAGGDKLLSLTGGDRTYALKDATQIPALTKQLAGQQITVKYERRGIIQETTATIRTDREVGASKETDTPKGYLGLSPGEYRLTRATWSAPIVAAGLLGQFTAATFQGLGTAVAAVFQGEGTRASEQVSGPLGIVMTLKSGSLLGYEFILMITAIISLSLAIMNVLPIPALDGGRLFMVLLSRAFNRKLTQEMEERIVGGSFVFLLFLIVLITIVDVRRFF